METIKLQDVKILSGKEKLPSVPPLVQQYLDLKKYQSEGKYFRIIVKQKSDPKSGAGIAYSNDLQIEKQTKGKWEKIYSTGMVQYRGAYNYEIDNWDLSLNDPAILEESENEVVYALRTGNGNVKAYRFSKGQPSQLVVFNARDYKATQERIELLQNVISDAEAFRSYVAKGLGHRWHTASKIGVWEDDCHIFDATGQKLGGDDHDKVEKNGDIVVLLADHADRDYDAISDYYQLFVWVRGKGFGVTREYRTGLRHPGGKFYRIGIGFNATITNRGENFLNLTVKVSNSRQQWSESRDFRVEWEGPKPTGFTHDTGKAMEDTVKSHQHNHPLYKPTRIIESVVDAKRKIASWILFEQIDTDRGAGHGEGWLGDQFRYSLWVKRGKNKPVQLHEDHAYIRPRSKSELTGTRGRDCTLKKLRIDVDSIKILHPEGECVETQKWAELTFKI